MTKVLLSLVFSIIALVVPESQSMGSPPTEPEPNTTESGPSAAQSRPPTRPFYDIKIVMAQMALGTFGLGSGPFDGIWTPQNQHAINAYQKIRGIPLTEGLNSTTLESLSNDLEEWRKQLPDPPPMEIHFTHWEDGYISAIGTWMSDKSEGWNLIHATSLSCWRKGKLCLEATAEYREDLKSLLVGQRFYEIDHWNETEIVTVKERNNCPVSAVHIDRSKETVTGTRFPEGDDGCHQQESSVALHLTDGYMLNLQAHFAKTDRFKPLIQAPGFALPNERVLPGESIDRQ